MAGVGFELRKLFRGQGIIRSVKAYAYSSMTTVGPMVLCMLMISAMQVIMQRSGSSLTDRELFTATVVYAFIFSVLITGGISLLLTRFIADRMYEQKFEYLLPSYYGSIGVCLPVGALAAWGFLHGVSAEPAYKLAAYLLFAELIVIWLQAVLLSALKDYKRIVRNFAYGVCAATAGAWLWFRYTPYHDALSVLAFMDLGLFITIGLISRHFEQLFPRAESRRFWTFLSYIKRYPSLLGIGTFMYAGVYVHSFVYWFGSGGETVAGAYRISHFYDLPVFYAYLSVIPTLVTFVVSVETSFYEKFRDYYTKIISGGTLKQIERAKREMQRTLMLEISFVMEIQLLFTILSLALGIKFLPLTGMTMAQLDTFKILVLGYFLFIITFVLLLLMLYYDDRKGVLLISGAFVALNAGLSYWTMTWGYNGLGMFLAALAVLLAALARLTAYVRNIDYYTFCSQPIMTTRKKPFWSRWRRKKGLSAAMMAAMILILSGCMAGGQNAEPVQPETASAPVVTVSDKFVEDKRIYARDDDLSVETLYLTILPDADREGSPVTWYGINRIQEQTEEEQLEVIVQAGAPDGSGPQSGMFGYGAREANGRIGVRGNTSRYASQKSYSIKLYESAGLWRDQKRINLNKHPYDFVRIRNKLSFDFMESLPDIGSLRTQFVHVYVKDLSEGQTDGGYVDYGLYTHVEQPNKTYLKNHWLDPNGYLYKAVNFEFLRYPDELKSENDPAYDAAVFESRLEIRGREEHAKLLQMLDDVNNLSIPIEEVMDKHFDLDNYLTWMALNILMDNIDTSSQNFLLYSPLNSDKWFFLPWDYDGAWEWNHGQEDPREPYRSGISNYWGSVLHNRFFRTQQHVDMLKNKMDELYQIMNSESVSRKVEDYRKVVYPFLIRSPDLEYLPLPVEKLDAEFRYLSQVPLQSMKRFEEDLQKPRPVFLDSPVYAGGYWEFQWDHSFDLQGDDLTYDWALAKDPQFVEIVEERKGLKEVKTKIGGLSSGTYYWRVIIHDGHGHSQTAFDNFSDEFGNVYFGIGQIEVN